MATINLEEAATVAAEFISGLDNLPAEVNFLLAEMKHKDVRSQELLSEIQKESGKYVRHSLRAAPSQALSPKDAATPAGVQAQYAALDTLAREKETLAARVVQLVARARTRLDGDLARVLVLQGEPEPAAHALPAAGYYYGATARNPVAALNESLRSAVAVAELPAAPAVPALAAGAPPTKRRRTGIATAAPSAGSIKLPSPAPVAAAAGGALGAGGSAGARSRLSQQVHPRGSPAARGRRATASAGPEADEDAEGEEDVEEDGGEDGGDAEDTQIYCFCQKMSYGEMIACDGPGCRYQWFHLDCVNLKPPLPDQWFCSDCQVRLGGALKLGGPERRKGRKK